MGVIQMSHSQSTKCSLGPLRIQTMMAAFLLLAGAVASQHHLGMEEHDLGFDSGGKLVFTQLTSEKRSRSKSGNGQSSLYNVEVGFDIQEMNVSGGFTMKFDKEEHTLRLDAGISPTGVAWGHYIDQIGQNGWSELFVDTTANDDVSNDVKMYSAGYVEGLLTVVRLSEFHYNTHKLLMRTEATKHALGNIKEVFKNQIAYMKEKANLVPHILAEEPADPYWKQSRYILMQLWGVCDGYNYGAGLVNTHKLTLEDMLVLNSGGELAEMIQAYAPQAANDRASAQNVVTNLARGVSFLQRSSNKAKAFLHNSKVRAARDMPAYLTNRNATKDDLLDDAHWEKMLRETGHCSALVKVAEDNKDIFVGHTTWDDYSKMTRIFKYYNFHLEGAATMATKIGFSSYPGLVSSTDNFYVMSSGLSVMDTSLEILNPYAWDNVEDFPLHPHIPNFVHLMATNRLAKNGAHWTRLFQTQNTGTYTSQWMVTDYNRFKRRETIPDNTFWVLEAVPGHTHAQDMSYHLRKEGYWPSFNRPYFDDIREVSGFEAAQKSRGKIYSWLNNPRAEIFRTAAASVNTLSEMRMLMSRNFYPFTGVLPADPGHDISARMDLSMNMAIPNGGIDAKIVNRCLFSKMQVQSISSPAHATVPAFEWTRTDGSETFPGYPHDGLPNIWNFEWVQQTPFEPAALYDLADC
jgi:hypothetical protein